MLSISSFPGVKEVPRKARLKVAFKFIIEMLASPPAPFSFTQNLMVISFLTEMHKGSVCYKYMF